MIQSGTRKLQQKPNESKDMVNETTCIKPYLEYLSSLTYYFSNNWVTAAGWLLSQTCWVSEQGVEIPHVCSPACSVWPCLPSIHHAMVTPCPVLLEERTPSIKHPFSPFLINQLLCVICVFN